MPVLCYNHYSPTLPYSATDLPLFLRVLLFCKELKGNGLHSSVTKNQLSGLYLMNVLREIPQSEQGVLITILNSGITRIKALSVSHTSLNSNCPILGCWVFWQACALYIMLSSSRTDCEVPTAISNLQTIS